MKIAIIGSGISGLYAAWKLSSRHQVTIFEKNDTLRFEGEFCKKIFNEGYEIAKNMNISM